MWYDNENNEDIHHGLYCLATPVWSVCHSYLRVDGILWIQRGKGSYRRETVLEPVSRSMMKDVDDDGVVPSS